VKNNKYSIISIPFSTPPGDYVAFISMNVSSWTGNVTKDVTGTYTLFADNTGLTNDASRGYVINTGSGNSGVRLESPVQTLFCPSYSYSVWIKITSALSTVVSNGIVGDFLYTGSNNGGSFFFYFSSAGVLTATHGLSPTSDTLTYSNAFVTLNTWIQLGVTYNNSTLLMTMYVNGLPIASKTKSASWTGVGGSNGAKISFGYAKFPIVYAYTGHIDNMRLYARELSSTEMYNIYGTESSSPTV
jgi:hypothetical protein